MRKTIVTLSLIALTASLVPSGLAKASDIDQLTLPSAQTIKLNVQYSDDMIHRADNLSKNPKDRNSIHGPRDGWNGNGYYGQKDLEYLRLKAQKLIQVRLDKEGIHTGDDALYELRVTIVDAKPSRPTFGQLRRQTNLSSASIALGGAKLKAELIDQAGTTIGSRTYAWYDHDLTHNFGATTWGDADQAIRRFARKTANDLSH